MPWQNVKKVLKRALPESAFALWIEPLAGREREGNVLDLTAPDQFFRSWVNDHYLPLIQEAIAMAGRPELTVRLSVAAADKQLLPAGAGAQLRLPHIPERRSAVRTLHPRYTFDEFMVGESNALAFSACQAIANGDTSLGQCLYIEAGTGLGKSHLSHAVAHYVLAKAPAIRLHYLTAQQLTGEMVRALKSNAMEQFKEKYHHHCDVLLLEDVQTLAGRTKTQAELAAALDALMDGGKAVVFTGGVAPRDIPNIDTGFRSRLSAGLITSINPPDLKTRLLIIRRKANYNNLSLSEELMSYLAENIRGDIRQLESAIVGLKAKSSLLKMAPDRAMVKEVVRSVSGRSRQLTVEDIRDFVADQFKVSVHDIQSKSRKKSITFPRQVAMFLARKHTDFALGDIGSAFNRDHSTVVHSVRVINETINRNGSVRGQLEHLSRKLREKFL